MNNCQFWFVWYLFCYALLSVLFSFAIILMGEREVIAYLIVFLMSCDCQCSVAFPNGAVG